MSKGKILVTGGAGYIGSHTVIELIDQGYEPIVVDNLSNSPVSVIANIEKIARQKVVFYQLDCGQQSLQKIFEDHKIDGIIHFAAYKAVGESVENPLKYYKNNLGSLINVLSAAKEHNCQNIVFSSSCTVYGNPDILPVDETAATQKAESPYGNTKIIGEQIITEFVKSNGCRSVSLRYFNPIGAHSSYLIGELPLGVPNNLVPYITQTSIGQRDELIVFGADYDTPDGSCIRDYIHVTDLANAHVRALEYMDKHSDSNFHEFFNISTGNGASVLEVIDLFQKTNDISVKYTVGPRRPGDVKVVYGSPKKAEELLGWKAEKSLEQALSDAWNWQKNIHEQGL